MPGDLATLRRSVPAGRLASLAHSTQGSFLRQLGWHTLARGWDGRALALAGADAEAAADALIGLAADALGVGRFAASATLLRRAERGVGGDPGVQRFRRTGWRCAGHGSPPSWLWPSARAQPRYTMPRRRSR